jgi:hypothetical protein
VPPGFRVLKAVPTPEVLVPRAAASGVTCVGSPAWREQLGDAELDAGEQHGDGLLGGEADDQAGVAHHEEDGDALDGEALGRRIGGNPQVHACAPAVLPCAVAAVGERLHHRRLVTWR